MSSSRSAHVLVAQRLNAAILPQRSRLSADLAGMEELVCCDSDASANRFIPTTVHVKAQAAKLFFHLQDFKGKSGLFFKLGDERFQVLA